MSIAPIRTEADHRAALDAIDRLWGAAPGTADGDLLDVLVDLVEHFETKLLGPVPHSAEAQTRARDPLGVSQPRRAVVFARLMALPLSAKRKRALVLGQAMRRHPEYWTDEDKSPQDRRADAA